jgi:tetratricopeptide (TPR) repeat protein
MEMVEASSMTPDLGRELEGLRGGARETYNQWAQRWVSVASDVAAAQLNAAYAYETLEDYDNALEALGRAESLGVEVSFDNLAGRRMILLAKAGRYPEATDIVDSLMGAGDLELMTMVMGGAPMIEVGAWALSLKVIAGDYEWATTTLNGLPGIFRMQGVDSIRAIGGTIGAMCVLASTDEFSEHRANVVSDQFGFMLDNEMLARCAAGMMAAAMTDEDPQMRRSLGLRLIEVGDSLGRAGRPELARDIARRALVAEDEELAARGLEFLRTLAELTPDDLAVQYQIGRLELLSDGDMDKAEQSFTAFLEGYTEGIGLNPRHAARWRLGLVYEKMGELDRAREEFQKALELNPGYTPARAALEALDVGEGR